MRYLRQRLERTPSWFLAAYVALVDAAVCFGIVPFELYCRSLAAGQHAGISLLLGILALNAALTLLLIGARVASTALIARGAKRGALAMVPVLYRKKPRAR